MLGVVGGAVLVHRRVSRYGGKAEVQAAERIKFGPLNWILEMFRVTRNLDCQFVVYHRRLSLPDRGLFPSWHCHYLRLPQGQCCGGFPTYWHLLAHNISLSAQFSKSTVFFSIGSYRCSIVRVKAPFPRSSPSTCQLPVREIFKSGG
jgi:hypothetical protein